MTIDPWYGISVKGYVIDEMSKAIKFYDNISQTKC